VLGGVTHLDWQSLQLERRPSGDVVLGLKQVPGLASPHWEHCFVTSRGAARPSFTFMRSYLRRSDKSSVQHTRAWAGKARQWSACLCQG